MPYIGHDPCHLLPWGSSASNRRAPQAMLPHLHPAALPRAITDPSGGVFLFASFIGTMIIVGVIVVLTIRTARDPRHKSPVLSDDGQETDGNATQGRE